MACIPADPDISGIGVRVAIYAQNLLSFVPTFWALRDGNVSPYELESVEDQSTTILVTAFAILISAMVEARTVGLSSFHANIVLNLSWMNNTNTFIYFILYVQHKSQHGRDRIDMNWTSWIRHVVERMSTSVPKGGSADSETQIQILSEQIRKGLWWSSNKRIRTMFRRIVLVLGSLHLSIMASLGIWLWRNPRLFGSKNTCAQATTVIVGHPVPLTSGTLRIWSIVIYSFFLAPGLNLLAPMGLFLGLFLLYQQRRLRREALTHFESTPGIAPTVLGLALLLILNVIFLLDIELTLRENRGRQATGESTWTFGQILAMLLLLLPLRDLLETLSERRETKHKKQLTDTLKVYIHRQAHMKQILDLVEDGAEVNAVVDDSECEYATALQIASSRPDEASIIALLSYGADPNMIAGKADSALNVAVLSGHIANVKCLLINGSNANVGGSAYPTAFHAAFNADPLKWDMVKLILLQNHGEKTHAFLGEEYGRALHAAALGGEVEVVNLLVQNGADVDFLDLQEQTTTLQAAALSGKREIIQMLLDNGAKVNAHGGKYGTALQAAAYKGNSDIVKLLVTSKAVDTPDTPAGDYGTALQAAAFSGQPDIVSLLLNSGTGVDVNAEGGKYHTALQAAALVGNFDIVRLLVDRGAVDRGGGEYGSALQAAAWTGKLKMVQQLVEHGAEVNSRGGKYGTALQAAALKGNLAIVRLLLDKKAAVHYRGGEYGTALQAAAFTGNKGIVELLLLSGAAVNTQCKRCTSKHVHNCKGGQYGTALQAASYKGHTDIVQLLLDNKADVEIQGGKHGTAIEAALQGGHESIAKKLLERVDVNDQMLQLCSYSGQLKTATLILRSDSDYDCGMALLAAAFGAQFEVAKLLLEKGANVDGAGPGHNIPSPLQVVCYSGWKNIADLLLDWDANVNAQGGNWPTALQAALRGGRAALARRLIDRKADGNAQGGGFPTAFELAVYGGFKSIVISLLDQGVDVTRGSGWLDPMCVVGICKNDPELRQRLASVNAPTVTDLPVAIDLHTFRYRAEPKLWELPMDSFSTTIMPGESGILGWGRCFLRPSGEAGAGKSARLPFRVPGIKAEDDSDGVDNYEDDEVEDDEQGESETQTESLEDEQEY